MTQKTPSGEPFEGKIGRTIADSVPWWPAPRLKAGAPDVVLVVLDDTGFAHLGCYGSTIETPNIDALAAGGARFTGFHTTALCSPTRACLLTGRNHHAVGMRAISNFDTGFPNMRGALPKSAATLAEILRDAGYATFADRQVAPRADGRVHGRRTLRQLAAAEGLRPLLRLPAGRDRPVPPGADLRQPLRRSAGDRRRGLPRVRGHRGPLYGDGPRRDLAGPRAAVLPLPGVRGDALAAPGAEELPGEVSRPLRRGLGCRPRGLVRAAEGDGDRARGHAACAAQPGRPSMVRASRQRTGVRGAAAGSLRGDARPHRRADRPADRVPEVHRPLREHPLRAALRQRREPGGRRLGRARRDEVVQRHAREPRRGGASASTTSAGRTATATSPGAGRRPATRR